MGRKLVQVDFTLITKLITQDHRIGPDELIITTNGIPENSRVIRAWVDQDRYPDRILTLLVESAEWLSTPESETYDYFVPVISRFNRSLC